MAVVGSKLAMAIERVVCLREKYGHLIVQRQKIERFLSALQRMESLMTDGRKREGESNWLRYFCDEVIDFADDLRLQMVEFELMLQSKGDDRRVWPIYFNLNHKWRNMGLNFGRQLTSLNDRVRDLNTLLEDSLIRDVPSQCLEESDLPVLERQRQIHVYLPESDGKFDKHLRQYGDGNFHKLVVFGPNYMTKEILCWKNIKKETLDHVLNNSQFTLPELMNKMASIEGEARAAYAKDVLDKMTGPEFQKMMAEDGCLFLMLAFSILGAGVELKFPQNHLVFGIGHSIEKTPRWLRSMFSVGNQVPFVVLEKLMELRFFQGLKEKKQWLRPLELAKRTLHKFLMVGQQQKPVDLIHCLQSIMLGTKSGSPRAIPKMLDDIDGISSAWQLFEQGVQFKKLEGELGSRGIHYKRSTLNAVLYLPVFRVDRYTKLIVKCLMKYEIVQEPRGIEPEVSSFFKVLTELIRTPQDVEVLSSCGIIQGEPKRLLSLLPTIDCKVSSPHLCHVMRQMKEDPPLQWRKFIKLIVKYIVIISMCLTFLFGYLQAHYTVLGYYKDN